MGNDNQQQFIAWLSQKLKVKDQNEFKTKLKGLGNEGIKQAYEAFVKEQNQQVPVARDGAKLDYLKCLKEFKKGGAVSAECGCKDKMKKGGKMEKDTKEKGKPTPWLLNKHQQGGLVIPNTPPANPFMVEKKDGTVGQWGNPIASGQRQFYLKGGLPGTPKSLTEEQLLHLRQNVPDFDKLVGPMIDQGQGNMSGWGPDQSDIIRKLLTNPTPAGDLVAVKGEGGPIGDGAFKFKTSAAAKKLTPNKVVMGQGAGTISSR